jgi:hypothetical protein
MDISTVYFTLPRLRVHIYRFIKYISTQESVTYGQIILLVDSHDHAHSSGTEMERHCKLQSSGHCIFSDINGVRKSGATGCIVATLDAFFSKPYV